MVYSSLFILLILFILLLFTGKISYHIGLYSFSLYCTYWFPYNLDYKDILSVSILFDYDSFGFRLYGLSNLKCNAGLFRNKQYGTYTLYSDVDAVKYLELRTKTDEIIIIGLSDTNQLNDLLSVLLERVKN